MTKKAKMTKPVVTMNEYGSVLLGSVCVGRHAYGYRIEFGHTYSEFTASQLRAIADFLDQLEGADLLRQVTE